VALDTLYSSMALGLPRADADKVVRCLIDLGFTLGHPALRDVSGLLVGLEEFRQHLGGRLTLTMLRGIGNPIDIHEVDPILMRAALERLRGFAPTPMACDGPSAEPLPFETPIRSGM
jgi:3-dehydroquinate synthase